MFKPSLSVAVVRDTSTGTSFLISVGRRGIDEESLAEIGYEISGYLGHLEQFDAGSKELFAQYSDDDRPEYEGPLFTECMRQDCDCLLAIDRQDSAPEYCAKHFADAEKEVMV